MAQADQRLAFGEREVRIAGLPADRFFILLAYVLAIAAFLFVCRVVMRYEALGNVSSASLLPAMLSAAKRYGMDAVTVSLVAFLALLVARISWRAGLIFVFASAAALLVLGAANVRVVALFQQPATVTLIKFAGLLDYRAAPTIAGYMNATDKALLGAALVLLALFPLVPSLMRSRTLSSRPARRGLLAVGAVALLGAPAIALQSGDEIHRRQANAGWWLLKSYIASPQDRVLSVSSPDLQEPFATFATSEPAIADRGRIAAAGVRNVVLIVMESVGAHYADPLRQPDATPHMAALLPQAAYFPNTYSAMPSSWHALISLSTGRYPPVTELADYGRVWATPNLINILRASGLRTGAFLASDWGYLHSDEFLAHHRLDRVEMGLSARGCPVEQGRVLPAGSDACTFARTAEWIGESDAPFLAMVWTNGTHYPYNIGLREASTSAPAENLRRYLMALAETDRLIGRLAEKLEAEGRLEDTLLVLVGDHGEAFGQHGNQVHGSDAYDETVRVPLMLVNRRLFSGTSHAEPVRLIDVPPTILGVLGQMAPRSFQGVDLSGPWRPRRAFFAAPWIDITLGYVEGTRKFNYLLEPNDLQAFDLSSNPGEDLSRRFALDAREKEQVQRRILNWRAVADRPFTGR